MAKTIIISGGPGSGKTAIINQLRNRGYACLAEVSRNIILDAKNQGIDQLFLSDPEEFSKRILAGRIEQFQDTRTSSASLIFIDRGLPDIIAYMDFKAEQSPQNFIDACLENVYDFVFLLPPWKSIYRQDNERYETFEEAEVIYENIKNTYKKFDYDLIEVPFGNLSDRVNYILNVVEYS